MNKVSVFVACPACGESEVPVVFSSHESIFIGSNFEIKAVCPFCRRNMVVSVSVQITANIESIEDYSPARDE